MKKFSEREGITKTRTEIQVDNIDDALRAKLWNALDLHYWRAANNYANTRSYFPILPEMHSFLNRLYNSFLKIPVDTIPKDWRHAYQKLRGFYFQGKWYFVYDFIEFIANVYEDDTRNEAFKKTCNEFLESEMSAWTEEKEANSFAKAFLKNCF